MNQLLEATEATPTADRRVRDYDELDDRAQAVLLDAVHDGATTVTEDAADAFDEGELVRFTGYYRVTIAQ
ncbi:hypothetical protein [Halobacterium yunchengense]|uniref:hypothetical protein n=1 Tax=Halobacterium yunchengense TaxID=3108497 RepID=UPI003008A302